MQRVTVLEQTHLLVASTSVLHIRVKNSPDYRKNSVENRTNHYRKEGVGEGDPGGKGEGEGSQSGVKTWVKNYQYPGRHFANICFPVWLEVGGDLVV